MILFRCNPHYWRTEQRQEHDCPRASNWPTVSVCLSVCLTVRLSVRPFVRLSSPLCRPFRLASSGSLSSGRRVRSTWATRWYLRLSSVELSVDSRLPESLVWHATLLMLADHLHLFYCRYFSQASNCLRIPSLLLRWTTRLALFSPRFELALCELARLTLMDGRETHARRGLNFSYTAYPKQLSLRAALI